MLWKWHMELKLSQLEVLEMEANVVTEAFETGPCSVTTVASVQKHQRLQPNQNRHVCTVGETMGYGAVHAFRALELRNVGISQRKRGFAFVA